MHDPSRKMFDTIYIHRESILYHAAKNEDLTTFETVLDLACSNYEEGRKIVDKFHSVFTALVGKLGLPLTTITTIPTTPSKPHPPNHAGDCSPPIQLDFFND